MKHRLLMLAVASVVAGPALAQTAPGFQINCTVKPSQEIQLSSSTVGIVSEVPVRPGQRVEAGEIIAQLDTDIAQADFNLAYQQAQYDGAVVAAELQVDSLAKRKDRLKPALDKKAIPEADYDAIVLEHALAKVTLERQRQEQILAGLRADRAEILVRKSTIYSPASGTIGEDLISVGENTSTAPIATIYVTSTMRVEAFVPTNFLEQILAKPQSEIIINDANDRPLTVQFDYGSPLANLSSNTISVYFTLKSDQVLPGSKCRMKV